MEHDGPPDQGTFAPEPPLDTDNVPRRPTLAEKFEASRAAFAQWETARDRTDQQLYAAIGRLAEFAASVGNDQQTLINFAARQGVHATKASSLYSVITKLVVTSDRRKASKYATVLQFAARRGIEPTAEATASFIRAEGGIEACLASFRALPKVTPRRSEAAGPRNSAKPSASSLVCLGSRYPRASSLTPYPVTISWLSVCGMRTGRCVCCNSR